MGFFDSLKSLFGGGKAPQDEAYWIYVRCRRCGEVIKTRLDLLNSLALNDEGGYTATLDHDGHIQVLRPPDPATGRRQPLTPAHRRTRPGRPHAA